MKIVHEAPSLTPEPPKLTFGELQRGEKFYHAGLPEGAAGLRQKLGGCAGNLVLNLEYPGDPSAYTLEASCPVRRASEATQPTWRRGVNHVKQGDVFICRGSRTFWIANDSGMFVSLGSGIVVDSNMFNRTEQMVLTGEFVYRPAE